MVKEICSRRPFFFSSTRLGNFSNFEINNTSTSPRCCLLTEEQSWTVLLLCFHNAIEKHLAYTIKVILLYHRPNVLFWIWVISAWCHMEENIISPVFQKQVIFRSCCSMAYLQKEFWNCTLRPVPFCRWGCWYDLLVAFSSRSMQLAESGKFNQLVVCPSWSQSLILIGMSSCLGIV